MGPWEAIGAPSAVSKWFLSLREGTDSRDLWPCPPPLSKMAGAYTWLWLQLTVPWPGSPGLRLDLKWLLSIT